MKRYPLLSALNAVYFGAAAVSAGWCVAVYGLTAPAAYVAGLTCCLYGLLSIAACFPIRTSGVGSLGSSVTLSMRTQLLLRATFLCIPLAYFAYIATYKIVENTYISPGGVDRLQAFWKLENFLFLDCKCMPKDYWPAGIENYMLKIFQPWARNQFHPPISNKSYDVVCRFDVQKDGAIVNRYVSKSSGNRDYDKAAMVAFDSVAPLPPPHSPDRMAIEFTFTYSVNAPPANKKTPLMSDADLLRIGKEANSWSDFPNSKLLLSKCLSKRSALFKPGSPAITDVLSELGYLYCRMGLLLQSRKYFDQAVANAEIGQKENRKVLVDTLRNYADNSFACGKYAEALSLYKRCFHLAPKLLNRRYKERLAQIYFALKEYDKATEVFVDVVHSDEQDPFCDESIRSSSRSTLCDLYIKSGRSDLSVKKINSYLSKYFAAKDAATRYDNLQALYALTPLNNKLSNPADGKHFFQSLLAELSKNRSVNNRAVKSVRYKFAKFLWKSGEQRAVHELFQHLLVAASADRGARSYALFQHARFLASVDEYAESERLVREALAIQKRLHGHFEGNLKTLRLSLASLLAAQHRFKEADSVLSEVNVSARPDLNLILQLSAHYRDIERYETSFELIDRGLQQNSQEDSSDFRGEKSLLLEQAIDLAKQTHDDKRLERYLNEWYQGERKQFRWYSRAQLIEFYITQNRLALAENLANQELNQLFAEDVIAYPHDEQTKAFLLLAQTKYAQHRFDSAKYYVKRAVDFSEPYGRSGVRTIAIGLLAQMLAKEGELHAADQLLAKLCDVELCDTNLPVYGDFVEGFSLRGEWFDPENVDDEPGSYEQQSDKYIWAKSDDWMYKREHLESPMVSLSWFPTENFDDFALLKAAALESRARILSTANEHDKAANCREQLWESLEQSVSFPRYGRNLEGREHLLNETPTSQRQQRLLEQIKRSKQELDEFYERD